MTGHPAVKKRKAFLEGCSGDALYPVGDNGLDVGVRLADGLDFGHLQSVVSSFSTAGMGRFPGGPSLLVRLCRFGCKFVDVEQLGRVTLLCVCCSYFGTGCLLLLVQSGHDELDSPYSGWSGKDHSVAAETAPSHFVDTGGNGRNRFVSTVDLSSPYMHTSADVPSQVAKACSKDLSSGTFTDSDWVGSDQTAFLRKEASG